MANPLVIAAFRSESEAREATKSLIENGIEADSCPRTEAIERICPDIFDDGFDVFVNSEDADRAVAVLRRHWPEVIDVEVAERCPLCASADISRLPRLRLFLIAAIVLFAVSLFAGQEELFLLAIIVIGGVLVLTPNRRCRACGERWRGGAEPR